MYKLQENSVFHPIRQSFVQSQIGLLAGCGSRGRSVRTNPLTMCPNPSSVKQTRSFIGAFRSISICIRKYTRYLSALADTAAGKESAEKIEWDDTLNTKFIEAQKALSNSKMITLPHPNDQLFLISDGCNSPPAVGSTLYVKGASELHIAGFFSTKIKKHHYVYRAK